MGSMRPPFVKKWNHPGAEEGTKGRSIQMKGKKVLSLKEEVWIWGDVWFGNDEDVE